MSAALLPAANGLARSSLPAACWCSEQKIDKPGTRLCAGRCDPPAGRGPALRQPRRIETGRGPGHWQIDVTGRACLDVGASTGGFTDCLLQHGAAHVTAVDTGFGQIAMKLRNDPRVRLMERTNARLLEPGSLDCENVAMSARTQKKTLAR